VKIESQLLYEIYKALITLQIALLSGIAVTIVHYGTKELYVELAGILIFSALAWLTRKVAQTIVRLEREE